MKIVNSSDKPFEELLMALITCMSPSRRGSKSVIGASAMNRNDDHTHEEDDSGCECSLEELEGLDAWTKTMVAVRVLTAFKMRRRKKAEQQEREKKERRKTIWRRLGLKLRIFNLFANKIVSEDPSKERLIKLKRKLGLKVTSSIKLVQYIFAGDVTIEYEEEAYKYQAKIEESLQYQLDFKLKPGDTILAHFDRLPGERKKRRRKSKVFERYIFKGKKVLNNTFLYLLELQALMTVTHER